MNRGRKGGGGGGAGGEGGGAESTTMSNDWFKPRQTNQLRRLIISDFEIFKSDQLNFN